MSSSTGRSDPSSPAPDFGPLAESYDRLRPVDDGWWELFELLVAEGRLAGQRVLDVGCGTGRLAAALAGRSATVWGVDPSEDMLRRARALGVRDCRFERASAEALPFEDGAFDAVVLRLVVHLVDRPRTFSEIARVLAPGGRLAIATFDPASIGGFWLARIFPAVERIDRGRFPAPDTLTAELQRAGFGDVTARRLVQRTRVRREDALERIRGRYVSTLRLLDEAELEEGLARAERELGADIEDVRSWAVLVARRTAQLR